MTPELQSDVWLMIPVYNEAPVVADVIRNAAKSFPNIVGGQQQRDGSGQQIALTTACLVTHPVNLGAARPCKPASSIASNRGRGVCAFSTNGQHRIEDALRMVARLRGQAPDIIIGSRFHGDISHIPRMKRVVLKSATALSPRGRRLGMTDSHNGLRAFNAKVAAEMNITSNGMAHAPEIIGMIDSKGWRFAEEPVHIVYSDYSIGKGQSSLNGVNIIFDSAVRRGRH